jgi:hypothetical protein
VDFPLFSRVLVESRYPSRGSPHVEPAPELRVIDLTECRSVFAMPQLLRPIRESRCSRIAKDSDRSLYTAGAPRPSITAAFVAESGSKCPTAEAFAELSHAAPKLGG